MKARRLVFIPYAVLVVARSFSEDIVPKAPSELEALKKHYQQDVETATRPIRDRYISSVRALLRATTQRGDLAGALAIQNELNAITASTGASGVTASLVGTWRFGGPGPAYIRTFHEDGKMTSEAFEGKTGSWELHDKEVKVTYPGGTVDVMYLPINPKGTKIRTTAGRELIATKQ